MHSSELPPTAITQGGTEPVETDAQRVLLRVLEMLEDAATLRNLDGFDEDERPTADRILVAHEYEPTNPDEDTRSRLEEIADEMIDYGFLSIEPQTFHANGWEPSKVPAEVEFLTGCGGPTKWVTAHYDTEGDLTKLSGHYSWGGDRAEYVATWDERKRWVDVDPASPYLEGIG